MEKNTFLEKLPKDKKVINVGCEVLNHEDFCFYKKVYLEDRTFVYVRSENLNG